MPTVDRHDWTEKRLKHLQELLDAGPTEEERTAIEAEMKTLRPSRGWWRRVIGVPRLPHQR